MNINEVHWNFSDNGTKEPAKSRFWNFYNFWTAWNFLMRFSLLCSGVWALSFYMCVFIYIGVSLNFQCLFTFNLVSFHASSRLILHAEVSYIIDIACHWSFFPILPVLATFWIAQTPLFFPFSNYQFLWTGTRQTYVHPFDLDYWAKTRYQPIFRHCLGAVLQYLAIFYENLH